MINPISSVLQYLESFGWILVGTVAGCLFLLYHLGPRMEEWDEAEEDAEYHKDPDKALARMEAIERAREKQQQMLLEASQRALEQQKEREERKRAEAVERLEKYGTAAGGRKLGNKDEDYLPLSAGESTSSYRPPKRSKCSGGGCGK